MFNPTNSIAWVSPWNYSNVIRWVRKSHGWVGLWGAVLGLLFGFSGIWLNHRTVLKLPATQTRSNAQQQHIAI